MTLNEFKSIINRRRMLMFLPAAISLTALMVGLVIGIFFPAIMDNAARYPDYNLSGVAVAVVGTVGCSILLWLYAMAILITAIDNIKVPDVYLDYLADVINDLPAPETLDSFCKDFTDNDLSLTYGEVLFFLAGQNTQKEKCKSKTDDRQIGPGAARLRDKLERIKMLSA